MKGSCFLLLGATILVTLTTLVSTHISQIGIEADKLKLDELVMLGRAVTAVINQRQETDGMDSRQRSFDQIVSVTKQIIQGTLYRYTIKFKINPDNEYEECSFKIWSRPFMVDEAQREIYYFNADDCTPVN